ncbi:MAG TPA: ATP-dependent DNA helicase [Bacteroidetes bacterium]|mgnify:CR=1 FL=1|nr:ATP-dependent DNA helicase [Bacteroidota bacterium]
MEYLKELNPSQREAVVNTEGPALVIAGAGSGKTRVLTYRVAHLLVNGTPAHTILALTFTNRAANEMKERIIRIVGEATARYLWMGTFHSIFARILRMESQALGYPANYSIYDTQDSKNLIKEIIRELNLDEKVYKPAEVLGRISSAKNNLITAPMYAGDPRITETDLNRGRPWVAEIYKRYAARCFKAGAMDFDDLLVNTYILLRDFPEILRKYQDQFRYILVDEYQDTNYVQYAIVKKLGEKHKNVCVVGDDAQSIYSFRGARIENILHFKNDYPGYRLFKLEQNYRSTQNIVNVANSLIARNRDQIRKTIFSRNEPGEKITVVRTLTDTEEGFVVANAIQDIHYETKTPYSEFAILYRTNAQSRIFEETLRKKNIPYRVYGAVSFYQRKEIKDLLAYFRLVSNPADDEALKRVINYPARGIGKTTLDRLITLSNKHEIPVWKVITTGTINEAGLNRGITGKIEAFTGMIRSFMGKKQKAGAYELAMEIATETGILKELYHYDSPEEFSRYENLQELLNGIREFVEAAEKEGQPALLENYLENVSLLTDLDTEPAEEHNRVKIMTVHSAKGLEFDYVFIAGMEEDLFPSHMSVSTQRELEEERRLFYVALTRARKKVHISYAGTRFRWGTPSVCNPSRFITELDEQYIILPEDAGRPVSYTERPFLHEHRRPEPKTSRPLSNRSELTGKKWVRTKTPAPATGNFSRPDDIPPVKAGMLVEHPRFGKGEVQEVEGVPPDVKATVFFTDHGKKQLLLKFARLKIIG